MPRQYTDLDACADPASKYINPFWTAQDRGNSRITHKGRQGKGADPQSGGEEARRNQLQPPEQEQFQEEVCAEPRPWPEQAGSKEETAVKAPVFLTALAAVKGPCLAKAAAGQAPFSWPPLLQEVDLRLHVCRSPRDRAGAHLVGIVSLRIQLELDRHDGSADKRLVSDGSDPCHV